MKRRLLYDLSLVVAVALSSASDESSPSWPSSRRRLCQRGAISTTSFRPLSLAALYGHVDDDPSTIPCMRGGGFRNKRKTLPDENTQNNRVSLLRSIFWSKGVLQVHNNYLRLLWAIAKSTATILAPIALLFTVGILVDPTATATFKSFLEVSLRRLQEWINYATLLPLLLYSKILGLRTPLSTGDYSQAWEDFGLPIWVAFWARPIMDTLVFRVVVKGLWDGCSRLFVVDKKKKNRKEEADPESLSWTLLSSFLYAISHLGTSLPPPNAEVLQAQVSQALRTGELSYLGMTLYRSHWNEKVVETLLSTQPLMQAIGHGVVNGILSWGLLCPLYQLYGAMASMGAQGTWALFGSTHVDTQILIRLVVRIFFPWSIPKNDDVPSSDDRVVSLLGRPFMDAIVFRWGVQSIWLWLTRKKNQQYSQYQFNSSWKIPQNIFLHGRDCHWMIWSSILFAVSHLHLYPTAAPMKGRDRVNSNDWGPWRTACFPEDATAFKQFLIQRLLFHGFCSYYVLCPLYQFQGLRASMVAQLLILYLRQVVRKQFWQSSYDNIILIRPSESNDAMATEATMMEERSDGISQKLLCRNMTQCREMARATYQPHLSASSEIATIDQHLKCTISF